MALYRLLLLLYPAAFRGQYGEELENIFRTRLRHSTGLLARLLLWLETAIDILMTAIQTHWDILCQDIRYTLRTLRRSPGFAATAIAVAALGIGATTAAYTLTDHILLRPLPYADQDRLVMLWEDMSPGVYREMEPSPANYRDWKRMSRSFSAMAAWRGLSVAMTGVGNPEQIEGASVSSDLFPTLGIQAILGRTFSAEDDRAGMPGTVVLSYGTWQARFAADPGILGRKLLFDGVPYTVIGVMPRSFNYPRREVEVWTAMRFENSDFEDRNDNYLHVVAKLRPGVSREQALAEMRIISQELKREYPKDNEHVGVGIVPLHEQYSERSRLMLLALLGAGLCVLLIACTNLANLLLARALVRRKEIAVRNALGAGRERLVRQMVTESLLVSLCGGLLGILLANASVQFLAKLVPDSLSLRAVTIDGRVLLFALALTVITGICFGIIPAAQSARDITAPNLAEGNRGGVGGRKERLRTALVIAEVSISFVLLIACGLLIRALWHLQQTDPGFRAENVLTMETVLQMPRYEKATRRLRFFEHVLPEIRQIPGVVNAAYVSFLPMVMRGGIFPITTAGHDPNIDRAFHNASIRFVTSGYFETMGIPLLRGRAIAESDSAKTTAVAVVSRSFAREYWPGQDAIGRHFAFSFLGGTYDRTVVGVVGDVRVRGLEGKSEPQVYLSYRQQPDGFMVWYAPKDLAIRSNMKAEQLLPLVRRILGEIDPVQLGLNEGPPNAHPGQGTANRRFAFSNAMLELLWVHEPREAQSQATARTMLWERWSGRRETACPFGICVRPVDLQEAVPPFPGWQYRPAYLPAPLSMHIGQAGVEEPMWVYLSFLTRTQREQWFREHPIGIREITCVTLYTPVRPRSKASQRLLETGIVHLAPSPSYMLEIEFDCNWKKQQIDFRPDLPVVFQM